MRSLSVLFLLLIISTLTPATVYADMVFLDLNTYYESDNLKNTTTTTNTKTFYDLAVGFAVLKNNRVLVGWSYASYTTSDSTGGTPTTYTSTQMGPKFIFYFDKSRNWRAGITYNINTKTTYNPGTAEDWKGTGLAGDLGYQFNLSDTFHLGFRINYSSTSFTEKVVGATTYSTISNSRVFMYPSIAMTFEL